MNSRLSSLWLIWEAMGSPYRIINRGDTWSVLYVRKHRLIGLEDSLEITHPVVICQGALATTLGILEGSSPFQKDLREP